MAIKTASILRLACIGQAMGHKVKIVVEKLSELTTLLAEIEDLGIEPAIWYSYPFKFSG